MQNIVRVCSNLHNVIAAVLDQLPVVGDHENGSAMPRFAFQPFCDQAHVPPVKAAGGLIKNQYPSFEAFSKAIADYIDYYNNSRIQAKTKWMPPSKFREASMMEA